ncbi:MAG: hypothetical protein RIA65_08530 [Woeseia sp.]
MNTAAEQSTAGCESWPSGWRLFAGVGFIFRGLSSAHSHDDLLCCSKQASRRFPPIAILKNKPDTFSDTFSQTTRC